MFTYSFLEHMYVYTSMFTYSFLEQLDHHIVMDDGFT